MALLQIAEPGQTAAPHQHKLAAGIDLGTTNSLVATVRSGEAKTLQNAQGDELAERLNSYLGVRKEHFLILEKTVEILSGSVRDFCFEYLNVSKDDYEKMRLNYLE